MCTCTPGSTTPTPVVVVVDYSVILERIAALRTKLEEHMATEVEVAANLDAKVDDLIADVRAALAVIADDSQMGTAGQAAFDTLTAKIDAFDAEVGDADGSETPPVDPPVDPTPEPTA